MHAVDPKARFDPFALNRRAWAVKRALLAVLLVTSAMLNRA